MTPFPKRGEVWWVNFDPSVGGEIQKTRPAIILSNNAANLAANRLQVVPLSSKTHKIYAGECLVSVLNGRSKAIASQLTTVSKLRLKDRIASLSVTDLTAVEETVKLQLGL